MKNKPELI